MGPPVCHSPHHSLLHPITDAKCRKKYQYTKNTAFLFVSSLFHSITFLALYINYFAILEKVINIKKYFKGSAGLEQHWVIQWCMGFFTAYRCLVLPGPWVRRAAYILLAMMSFFQRPPLCLYYSTKYALGNTAMKIPSVPPCLWACGRCLFLRGLLLPRLSALPWRLFWEQSSSSRLSIRPAPSTGQSVGWSTLLAPRTGPVLWDA